MGRFRTSFVAAVVLWLSSGAGVVSAAVQWSEIRNAEMPISMSLRDAALAEVLDSLARIGEVELAYTPEAAELIARSPVTVELDEVPLRTALSQILIINGLELTSAAEGELLVRTLPADVAEPDDLAGPAEQDPLDLDLEGAALHEVLDSMAAVVGAELETDPGLAGEVTMTVQRVDWSTAMDAICEPAACAWELVEGRRRVLRVTAGEPVAPDERMTIQADEGKGGELVVRMIRMTGLGLSARGSIGRAPITVRLEDVSWPTAFDVVCQTLGCAWELLEDPPTIQVTADVDPPRTSVMPLAALEEGVSLELEGAAARDVLTAMASVLDAVLVVRDAEITGEVSVDWSDRTVSDSLDELCERLGLEWSYLVDTAGARLLVTER